MKEIQCCDGYSNLILNLDSEDALLANSGGKAENLSKLKRLGYSVPRGFIITTDLYDNFIDSNEIRENIDSILSKISYDDLQDVNNKAQSIRDLILNGRIISEIEGKILETYSSMGNNATVAVRSSATMEDLPSMSFAGQQDTYLNIQGEAKLIEAVKLCWSSLWTKRAILYRHTNKVDNKKFSIAVVVQEMIVSEYSGVTFTINPLNGFQKEMVVEVVKGLGEQLVSGQIEPQQLILDKKSLEIKSNKLQKGETKQFLTSNQIQRLGNISQKIEHDFGGPQDIEWAYIENKLYILQTRPITSYYPIPKGFSGTPLHLFGSFGAVQGMLDPISPLGQDVITLLIIGVGNMFGANWKLRAQKLMYVSGERLWFDMTGLLHNPLRDKIIHRLTQLADPSMGSIIDELSEEFEVISLSKRRIVKMIQKITRYIPKIAQRILKSIANPLKSKVSYRRFLNELVENHCDDDFYSRGIENPFQDLKRVVQDILKISTILPAIIPRIIAPISTYSIQLALLKKLYSRFLSEKKSEEMNRILTEGFQDTVTTNMGLELLNISKKISLNAKIEQMFDSLDKNDLGKIYSENKLPEPFQSEIHDFMIKYGTRGIGEFDIGKPRWRETPSYVIQMIKNNIGVIQDKLKLNAIDKKKRLSAIKLEKFESELYQNAKNLIPFIISKKLRNVIQNLMGVREDHKFMIIKVLGKIRKKLLDIGENLAERNLLESNDDLFCLKLEEIHGLSKYLENSKSTNEIDFESLKKRISERREIQSQEQNRKTIPKVILSDGRMFRGDRASIIQEGMKTIKGQPVSSGIVKGKVRVIFDPNETTLQKGEILVCRGTDPAWTPLFLIASGVIMEVGGMMTHGAVVAREYNLPGIVGISNATEILKNGQTIEMNGFTGSIRIFD